MGLEDAFAFYGAVETAGSLRLYGREEEGSGGEGGGGDEGGVLLVARRGGACPEVVVAYE